MSNQNIFEILTSDPVSLNKWNLKSNLILAIHKTVRDNGWNQTEAAAHLGISQPRVSNMLKGKLDKFSTDSLLEIMFKLGYKLDMQVNPSSDVILEMDMKKAML